MIFIGRLTHPCPSQEGNLSLYRVKPPLYPLLVQGGEFLQQPFYTCLPVVSAPYQEGSIPAFGLSAFYCCGAELAQQPAAERGAASIDSAMPEGEATRP